MTAAPSLRHALIAKAAEQAVVEKEGGPKQAQETEAVRGVVAALMHELECILHEYLSFNWDRVDEIYEANKHLLREEGLVCAWKSLASLAVRGPFAVLAALAVLVESVLKVEPNCRVCQARRHWLGRLPAPGITTQAPPVAITT